MIINNDMYPLTSYKIKGQNDPAVHRYNVWLICHENMLGDRQQLNKQILAKVYNFNQRSTG